MEHADVQEYKKVQVAKDGRKRHSDRFGSDLPSWGAEMTPKTLGQLKSVVIGMQKDIASIVSQSERAKDEADANRIMDQKLKDMQSRLTILSSALKGGNTGAIEQPDATVRDLYEQKLKLLEHQQATFNEIGHVGHMPRDVTGNIITDYEIVQTDVDAHHINPQLYMYQLRAMDPVKLSVLRMNVKKKYEIIGQLLGDDDGVVTHVKIRADTVRTMLYCMSHHLGNKHQGRRC